MNTTGGRYDGYADWYDAHIGPYADAAGRELLDLLGSGPGRCLDLACGTGINLQRLTDAEWTVTGVDLSADQLRVARERAPGGVELLQADATALPFADASFDAIACSLLHTDVADFTAVCREAARVLKTGGRFAYVGIHPCFVGPFARNPPGEPPELHPGYRDTSWTREGFSDGIRRRAGARHVPLAELLNAFIDAGFRVTRVTESEDEEFPMRIGVVAVAEPHPGAVARRIRPIVIGVAVREDHILAVEGYDQTKDERFYRPPGGGLEFGETSEDALRREFREELDAEIADIGYLGAVENVFTFDGDPGHEIVLVHRVALPDDERFRGDTVIGSESDGTPFTARWLQLAEVRSGAERLYPDRLLELLDTSG